MYHSAQPLQAGLGENSVLGTDCRFGAPVRSKLNALLTFENFVTGKAKQLARAAALQVASNPGRSYNPLFLYGSVGLGKTHVIHAIGNHLKHEKPAARIRYIHAE